LCMKSTHEPMINMKKRIEGLQTLRGIAFLLIFVSHCSFITSRTTYFGAFGVSLFIVLSGFLDMVRFDEKPSENTSTRVKGKLKKVYPLHIVTMVGALPFAVHDIILGSESVSGLIAKIVANLLLLQGYIPVKTMYFSLNAVAWYLTLVLTVTVISPRLACLIKRIKNVTCTNANNYARWGGIACAIIIILQTIWSAVCKNSTAFHWMIYINPLLRILDYILGMISGYVYVARQENSEDTHEHRRIPKPIAVCTFIIATLAMLIISCLKEESPWMLVVVWAPLSTAAVYIFALSEDFPKSFRRLLFENKALEWIGNISFELFLIHQLVIRYWNSIMLPIETIIMKVASAFICLALSIMCAYIWRLIIQSLKQTVVKAANSKN